MLAGLPLRAAEIVVTTTDDTLSGPGCSLRAALRASDLDMPVGGCSPGRPGADRVLIPAGTFSLVPEGPGDDPVETGDLDVQGPVEIVGAGRDATILRPAGLVGGATDRILEVHEGGLVTLSGVALRDGRAARGGGLLVGRLGTLALADCRLAGNEATAGGGLYLHRATATIERCEINANRAAAGGGIYQLASTSTLRESLLAGNEAAPTDPLTGGPGPAGGGGAVAVFAGSAVITTSEVVDNRADDTRWGGGGILAVAGTVTLSRSTLAGNAATDAADDGSTAHPAHDASGGGGISAWDATVQLENATLSGNAADDTRWGGGGILSIGSDVAAAHTTFWQNTADSALTIDGSFAGGSISAVAKNAEADRTLVLEASILAGASPAECLAGTDGPPDGGSVPNAIDDATCVALAAATQPATGLDARLGLHGGPTRTHRLLAGSSAVDAGGAACVGADGQPLPVGQRGVARPQDGGCDLGAVERTSTVSLTITGQPATTLPEPGGTVDTSLTFDNPGPLPITANLEVGAAVGGDVTGLGTCGPSVEIVAHGSVACQIELTVAGNAGPLGVTVPVTTRSPDAAGTATLQVDVDLADVPPSLDLRAFVKPGVLEAPGGTATLHIAVTNASTAEPVTVVELADEAGSLGGTCTAIGSLAPGATATCTVDLGFGGVAGARPTRTVVATAEDDEGNPASDTVVVGPQLVPTGSIIFQDCFESGDVSAWSASLP